MLSAAAAAAGPGGDGQTTDAAATAAADVGGCGRAPERRRCHFLAPLNA